MGHFLRYKGYFFVYSKMLGAHAPSSYRYATKTGQMTVYNLAIFMRHGILLGQSLMATWSPVRFVFSSPSSMTKDPGDKVVSNRTGLAEIGLSEHPCHFFSQARPCTKHLSRSLGTAKINQ